MSSLSSCCLILLLLLLSPSLIATSSSSLQQQNNYTNKSFSSITRDSLFKCELSYLQMDTSLIKFSIEHLLVGRGGGANDQRLENDDSVKTRRKHTKVTLEGDNFQLEQIDYNSTIEELQQNTRLNPRLPFIFFINGFNTLNEYGEINGTWMFDVAKNLAKSTLVRDNRTNFRTQTTSDTILYRILNRLGFTSGGGVGGRTTNELPSPPTLEANVIFLTWGIPQLIANNMLSMIPAYYKTVANYDLIMEFVAQTISQMVRFVEVADKSPGESEQLRWTSQAEREQFYLGFKFYGHSLGSHILADAIQRVRLTLGLGVKFGRLTGLDPATPCFLSLEHGISAFKVENSIDELVVVHSNAGLAGLTSERADIEIVLNGGTFQPGCGWYDFACHHSRSTDILRYRDDECQLIAYKCTSYHHFKSGACETCDLMSAGDRTNGFSAPEVVRNCVLVNMPEQHHDSEQILQFAESINANQVRQLAGAAAAEIGDNSKFNRSNLSTKNRQRTSDRTSADDERAKKSFYHFVNTSPNFRFGRKSHCLQHYQLRLIVYHENGDDKRIEQRCRPSSYLLYADNSIIGTNFDEQLGPIINDQLLNLKLFYEPQPMLLSANINSKQSAAGNRSTQNKIKDSSVIQLNPIIKDILHTALYTSEREPKLFVGALVDNLNVRALAQCYERENATSGPSFILDIAFMSHTNSKIRHAFSSILCGKIKLSMGTKNTTTTPEQKQNQLMLGLCKQSQLRDVSAQIDKLLDQIKLQRLDESWKVSLLNNLFSLFAEWEPF